jgi:hypothetical protein
MKWDLWGDLGLPASSRSGCVKYEGLRSRYSFRLFLIRILCVRSSVKEGSSRGIAFASWISGIVRALEGRCGNK